ncbi:DUF1002 domain-containing protein [Alicyclobacillus kakegawensis]|uniref:DUF1002 domain-containing protein n=1 Tax=Alicyclobacillus kakegawensis TaxID=392012 RepID=UPI000834F772|nr:DUF1002 domain-containing protein [Alicyclobacillus kakegawensis]
MKKRGILVGFILTGGLLIQSAWADATPGERVITLGNDLTEQQKQQIENDFSETSRDKVITVTHEDEERQLNGIVPQSLIGDRAISSSLIVLENPGYGIRVTTKNITWVTSNMYTNALLTAGVKDADITVEAPFPVSGTAALVGITKAFEAATGQTLNPNREAVANQEMMQTAQLGQQLNDPQKAAAFVNALKDKVSQEHPQTDGQYRDLILQLAHQMNITLNNQQINGLIDLLKKFNALHLDWGTLSKEATNVQQFIHNHPKQENAIDGVFRQITSAIRQIISAIAGLFQHLG